MKTNRPMIGIIAVVGLAVASFALLMQSGTDPFGWWQSEADQVISEDIPEYVSVSGDAWQPARFPADCGDDVRDQVRMGYGIPSIEHAARDAAWIVEGTARIDGPAQWVGTPWTPEVTREDWAQSASSSRLSR